MAQEEHDEMEKAGLSKSSPSDEASEESLHPYDVKACSSQFITGPIWNRIRDQQTVTRESEWIVHLHTSKWSSFLTKRESTSYPKSFPPEDYTPQMKEIQKTLEKHNVELILNDRDYSLIVAGQPDDVLKIIKESCDIRMMDMTGFHCDCAPKQCMAARTCTMKRAMFELPDYTQDELKTYRRVDPAFNFGFLACQEDVLPGKRMGRHTKGLRGISWFTHGLESWRTSSCRKTVSIP